MPRRTIPYPPRLGQTWPSLAVAGLLTALCLALPTANATGDAWYYAACARWGQELWQPHHLLYNSIGALWLLLLGASGPAPAGLAALAWLQSLNALVAGGCLLALAPLLRRAGAPRAAVPAWLLLVGSCFGMLRFATENETYIQPLLLALLASLAWARAIQTKEKAWRWLLLAGLLAALACLVHQLMVWWWLGLLLGLRPWRGRAARAAAACYAAPALLVPLAYALAAPGGVGNVVRFALHDYLTGNARVEIGGKSLLLTAISLVRTAVQVHGNLLPLLHRWPLLLGGVALGSVALGVYSVLGCRPARPLPPLAVVNSARTVRRTHLLIGALHLGFAAQAAGNAEFMVMLPVLAAVALAGGWLVTWPPRRVAAAGVALLSWNLAFGLLPAHLLDYTGTGPALRARVLSQPGAWFLLRDPNLLRNQLQYYTGRPTAAPRILGLVRPDTAALGPWLIARLAAGDTVYTDALGGYRPFDRAQLMQGDAAAQLLAGFAGERVDSFPTFFGPSYLTRLLPAGVGNSRTSQPRLRASTAVKAGASR
ncbi:hypothetical protein E4631_02050 [Hymenobacter sp. UV11]|uniref:hypothetical protein n=1 Tax=Hymenobacter sp. UV11 TaxID=1849735 RepID=UPI0010600A01|nr:hypothetical protein [Hymenobacter sp. UV11]TDN37667.1 hypothetical protein A8B98_03875 [Hymenobacter sp. UV11]TFZ68865.1 hypothetical protein E4631_02050 [Hymenobacter sp. UV11]